MLKKGGSRFPTSRASPLLKVSQFAEDLGHPRGGRTAPNESDGPMAETVDETWFGETVGARAQHIHISRKVEKHT